MANFINSMTTLINDVYDYYLWTLSLAGMMDFLINHYFSIIEHITIFVALLFIEIILRSNHNLKKNVLVIKIFFYTIIKIYTNFSIRRKNERMAASRFTKTNFNIHDAVPYDCLGWTKDHEKTKSF